MRQCEKYTIKNFFGRATQRSPNELSAINRPENIFSWGEEIKSNGEQRARGNPMSLMGSQTDPPGVVKNRTVLAR